MLNEIILVEDDAVDPSSSQADDLIKKIESMVILNGEFNYEFSFRGKSLIVKGNDMMYTIFLNREIVLEYCFGDITFVDRTLLNEICY